MIEEFVLDFLRSRLDVPVLMEYPKENPDRFVVLRRGDSQRENRIDTAMFVADSYGESLWQTARLHTDVLEALDDLESCPEIGSSRRAVDYPAFDEEHRRYRCQAVQNITHYF